MNKQLVRKNEEAPRLLEGCNVSGTGDAVEKICSILKNLS